MSDSKKFFELVASNKAVQAELEKASLEALKALVAEKGLKDEAQKALTDAAAKVAEAHGLKLGEMEEISPEEMQAVAGGRWSVCGNSILMPHDCGGADVLQVLPG